MTIKVVGNVVNVKGIEIEFDSVGGANSFLLDYISNHNQVEEVASNKSTMLDDILNNYGAIEIENLDLSVRSYNCLKRSNINTIEDIISLSFEDITRVRNLGRRSVEEIEEVVNNFIRNNYINWTNELQGDTIYHRL